MVESSKAQYVRVSAISLNYIGPTAENCTCELLHRSLCKKEFEVLSDEASPPETD